MKINKLLLPLFLALPLLSGCNNQNSSDNAVLLNGFESISDLYNFKFANSDSKNQVKFDISDDKTYVTDGNSSLKIDIKQGEVNGLIFPFERKETKLFDYSDLDSIEFDIYNDSNSAINFTNILYTKGLITLLKEDKTVAAHSWSHVKFSLSALAIENNYHDLSGFELKILSPRPLTLYLDKVVANVGLKYSAEDLMYQNTIKEIQEEISNLPEDIKRDDYDKLEAIYKKYATLPQLFRRIVSNYSIFAKKLEEMSGFVDIEKPLIDGQIVFDYDKFIGIGQIKNHPATGGDCEFFYQKEIKYNSEEGAVRVDFNGKTENYLGYTYPQNLSKYEYLVYHVYIDDVEHPDRRILYFGWEHPQIVEPNVWTTIKVDPSWILTAPWGIIAVQVANGSSVSSTGSMYIGSVYGKLASFEYFDDGLNDKLVTATGIRNEITKTNGGASIVAKEEGIIDIRFNKNHLLLSSEEAAMFNLNSPIEGTISLCGFDGEVVQNLNVNKGWNTIQLDNVLYEKVHSIKMNVKANQTIGVFDFIVYRSNQKDIANLVTKARYMFDADNVTVDKIPEYLYSIEDYEQLDANKLAIISSYNPSVANKINSLKTKISSGSNNLISQYFNSYVASYDGSNIPTVLISMINNNFLRNNVSSALLNEMDTIANMYKISYGDEEPIKTGIDYPWEGTITKGFDLEKGTVWNINISKMNFSNYVDIENGLFNIEDCAAVAFDMYNPLPYDVTMIYYNVNGSGQWEEVTVTSLKNNSWNHIELQAKKVTGARNFICLSNSRLESSGWKITNYYGIKYSKYAYDATLAIKKLSNNATSEIDKMRVLSAESLYNSLTPEAKAYVEGYNKLQSLLPINDLYTASEISSGWSGVFAKRVFSDYGFAGSGIPGSGNQLYHTFENSELNQLAAFNRTVFYIYVPSSIESAQFFMQYDATWHGKNQKLIPGEWNRIEISSDEWFDGQTSKAGKTYAFISSTGNDNSEWLLTSIYGYKN